MKKGFCFLLSFILIFNIFSFSVFAESTDNSASDICYQIYSGFYDGGLVSNSLGNANKKLLMSNIATRALTDSTWASIKQSCDILSTAGTSAWSGYGILYKYCRASLRTPADCDLYLKSQYSFDSENDSYDIGSSAQDELSDEIDSFGYTVRYLPGYNYVNPSYFASKECYNSVISIMKSNPDYLFYIWTSSNIAQGYSANSYMIYCVPFSLSGGVLSKSLWNSDVVNVTLYNDDWSNNFAYSNGQYLMLTVRESPKSGGGVIVEYCKEATTFDVLIEDSDGNFSVDLNEYNDFSVNQTANYSTSYFSQSTTFKDLVVLANMYQNNSYYFDNIVYTGSKTVTDVTVYNSLNNLKKGTLGLTASSGLLPNYNGSVMPSVTVSQVQNATPVINNYMKTSDPDNGGGSNNNNNNNNNNDDDSGGIWDTLASAIKHLINLVIDVAGSAIEKLASLFESLVDLFDSLGSLVGSGFADLMGAFFPYLPSEWITLVSLTIGLVLFFWVLKKFL